MWMALATNLPSGFSEKNAPTASLSLSKSFSIMDPSNLIPCSKQNNSQQELPAYIPPYPRCKDITSFIFKSVFKCEQLKKIIKEIKKIINRQI